MTPATLPPPRVIEFVGAPGAGKSTLLPIVAQVCRDAGYEPATVVASARGLAARTRPGRVLVRCVPAGRVRAAALWALFRVASGAATLRQIGATWPLCRDVVRSQRGRPAAADVRDRRVRYWFARLLGAHGLFLAQGRPGEVLVLDEGYVHRVVQLFASSVEVPENSVVRRYLALVPEPDVLVVVEAPIGRCVERVRARGPWSRFGHRPPEDLAAFVANAHTATTAAAAVARARGWVVVTVHNDGDDPEPARRALRERLARTLGVDEVAAVDGEVPNGEVRNVEVRHGEVVR
jgi:adenylate kinase